MSNCSTCNSPDIYKSGRCKACFEKSQAEHAQIKSSLEALANEASTATPAKNQEISAEAKDLISKARSSKIYTADIHALANKIEQSAKPKKLNLSMVFQLASIVMSLAVIFLSFTTFNLRSRLDSYESVLSSQKDEIKNLESQLSAANAAPQKKSYIFQNGNFKSGKDFVPGVYDIEALSGKGTVISDNLSGGIAAMMGNGADVDRSYYEKKYSNIELPSGTTLTIDGVKVKLTLVEAY